MYKHWRGPIYPSSLPACQWFAFYASLFDTVEINNTFYRLPSDEVVDGWARQAPSQFVYALKLGRSGPIGRNFEMPNPGCRIILIESAVWNRVWDPP